MILRAAPALILLTPWMAGAQANSGSAEFEAASIKPVPHGTEYGGMRGGPGTSSPGQINYEATTLRSVIARAFGVQRFQIAGPRWLDDERFDITAKLPPGTTMPLLQLMLQKLLADRMHLELHKENRPSTVYELAPAKSGPKVKPAALPATTPSTSGDTQPAAAGMRWSMNGAKIELQGHSVTIRQFLVWLNEQTRCDTVDKTGLEGAYDFAMSWRPEPSMGQDEPYMPEVLRAAIERDLGLKLTEHRVAVETLVIDRLDRTPVEN